MSTALVHHISGSLAFKRQSSLCSFQLLRRVDEHCATIYILHTHTHTHSIFPHTCACTHALTHTLYLSHSSTLTFRFARTLSDSFGTHIWRHDRIHSTLSPSLPISFSFSFALYLSFETSPFVHLYFLGVNFYLCPSVGRLSFLVVENCKSFNLFAHMSCHDRGKNNPPLPAHTLPGQPIAAAYPEKLIKISATNSLEDFPLCQSEAIKFSF